MKFKVLDLRIALIDLDYKVDVYDPLIDKDDFKKEFNINLVKHFLNHMM